MRNTQILVWEIQYPNTFCQYQDTVDLQETLLLGITDKGLAQGIRTMTLALTVVVHQILKVPGGIAGAIHRISMVSTTVGHTLPMLMV